MQIDSESQWKIEILEHPFPCVVIDDFLPPPLLESVSTALANAGEKAETRHPAGYRFTAFFHDELIRFLYRFVRRELARHLPEKYGWSKVYRLPQAYKIRGPWPGLAPHTDNQPGRELAMIIYLSQGWRPEYGGELNLFSTLTGPEGAPEKKIAPLFNRAVFFPLGPSSWHSVSPLASDWERVTVIQDWERETD